MALTTRSRRVQQWVCGALLVFGVVLAYVALALTPTLLAHHAITLEAMTGSVASVVTGGAYARVGRAPLWLVVVAPFTGIAFYGLPYWWAGRLWGHQLLEYYCRGYPRRQVWVRRAEALVRRWGVWAIVAAYVLPIPALPVEVLCGVSLMPLWLYLVGQFVGMALWVGLLVGLGWSIGHPAVHAVNVVTHYALWVTIGIVVVIFVTAYFRARRSARSEVVKGYRQPSVDNPSQPR